MLFKNNSKIDLVFILILCVFLVLPVMKLYYYAQNPQAEESLTKWRPMIKKYKNIANMRINYNFDKDYEKWLKDRILFSKELKNLYAGIIYKISRYIYKNEMVVVVKNNNYFYERDDMNVLNDNDINAIGLSLSEFQKELNERNIKLYVVTAPKHAYFFRKHDICYKNPKKWNPLTKSVNNGLDKLGKVLNEKYRINYLDLRDEYEAKQKEDFVFYKTDHHPSDFGCYVFYQKLMSVIKKDFPDIKINNISNFNLSKNKLVRYSDERNFHLGAEHRWSNLTNEKLLDTEYTYFDYKGLNSIKVDIINPLHQRHVNPNGKYKLLLIGDSFVKGYVYFLNTSFHDIDLHRVNVKKYPFDIKPFYKVLDEFKPDIVVLFRLSGRVMNFKYIYLDRIGEFENAI